MPKFEGTSAIETYSGVAFDPLDPEPASVRVEDVAHGLANTCRYGGQCQFYYSVATHALYVSRELDEYGPLVQLYGLFHDASEAYITDVPRPVKRELDEYDRMEREILAAVWDRLDVPAPTDEQWAAVMDADDRLLRYEADTLLSEFAPSPVPDLSHELTPGRPGEARDLFLDRAEQLRERV
jgi:hypothetical protein